MIELFQHLPHSIICPGWVVEVLGAEAQQTLIHRLATVTEIGVIGVSQT